MLIMLGLLVCGMLMFAKADNDISNQVGLYEDYKISTEKGSFTEAKLQCSLNRDSLLNWFELNSSRKHQFLASMRQSNISRTWINGHISYSDFFSWEGCVPTSEYVSISSIHDNNVYTCSKVCLHKYVHKPTLLDYIGLSGNACYCLETIVRRKAVHDSFCFHTCQNSDMSVQEYCGSQGYIGVYKRRRKKLLLDKADIPVAGSQCVAVSRQNGTNHYVLQSCSLWNALFPCEDQIAQDSKINETGLSACDWTSGKMVCVLNDTETWNGAMNLCLSHNARLIEDPAAPFEKRILKNNTWY